MNMVQCERGHFYDQDRSRNCPYCNPNMNQMNRTVAMMPEQPQANHNMGFTMPMNDNIGKTVAVLPSQYGAGPSMNPNQDTGKTVAVFSKKQSFKADPVVGWLVIITGSHKGEDYKIHSDNNFIGRSPNMDVCLGFDETVSRENHAIISFDTREKRFFLSASNGRAIIRLNNTPIYNTAELFDYDKVEIGETTLLFRSLCGDNFTWEE